ncbi:Conserved_hypothetical protein [Hexamita inflata]|uniref:Uncharacterized protein n=1 Tax=Hexamita inflata TaxID=28002 RepID=A0AA86NYL8_9EUKA|nr:Conserved hypothetical protein [Hexamita inflata]
MSSDWHLQVPQLLQQFLLRFYPGLSSEPAEVHRAFNDLKVPLRRGIFEFVASQLRTVTPADVKNYYHNTWVKQFSESPAPYRSEIQELVREVVVTRGEEVREAIRVFVARHPDKQFNLRQLQQVFNIAKYRTKAEDASEARSEGSDGFSVSIDQCLLFQTACGMQE